MSSGVPPFLIITGPCLGWTHGTGAQLLTMFSGAACEYRHLYWNSEDHGISLPSEPSYLLEDAHFRTRMRGKMVLWRAMGAVGLSWWKGNAVNKRFLERLRREMNFEARVAYILPSSEQEAERAASLLGEFRLPYVVHLFDLQHGRGIDPETMPGFRTLLRGAHSGIALTPPMKREMERAGMKDVELLPFGRALTGIVAKAPAPGGQLNVLMIGSLAYDKGLATLAEAWPRLLEAHPGLRLVYAGPERMLQFLPGALRGIVDYRGFVDEETRDRLLAEAHLAYLPGPTESIEESHYSRFSVPSRLSDYLMYGIPVIANVPANSATAEFLAPIDGKGTFIIRGADELVRSFSAILASPDSWLAAHRANRDFAVAHLDIAVVRDRILQRLSLAAAGAA